MSIIYMLGVVLITNAEIINVDGVSLDTAKVNREIVYGENEVVVTYKIPNVMSKCDEIYPDRQMITLDGFTNIANEGEPSLPIRCDVFAVPRGKSASVKVVSKKYMTLDMSLSPARPPLVDSDTVGYSLQNVPMISSYRGYFPSSTLSYNIESGLKGTGLCYVTVLPFSYNEISKKLRVYYEITYRVNFSSDNLKQQSSTVNNMTEDYSEILRNIVVNPHQVKKSLSEQYDFVSDSLSSVPSRSDYLIVTSGLYAPYAKKFARWKRAMGFNVSVVSNMRWTVEDVENSIKTWADSVPNPEYLLLFGPHSSIPGKMLNFNDRSFVSDYYYGCLESEDVQDLFVGRVPVSSLDEANEVVNKLIEYERNPTLDASFYSSIMHSALFEDYKDGLSQNIPDGYEDRRFVLTSEEIRNGIINVLNKSVNRCYTLKPSNASPTHWNNGIYSDGKEIPTELRKPYFGWNDTYSDVVHSLNEGVLYAMYRGHGGITSWDGAVSMMTSSAVSSLTNKDKYPLVFSICCNTGAYNYGNSLCVKLFNAKQSGAVGVYGATDQSYSRFNDALACGMIDAIWPELNLRPAFGTTKMNDASTTPTPTYRFGQILKQGLFRMHETYGYRNDTYSLLTKELFMLFGDPSMRLYTDVPKSFSGFISTLRGSNSITVQTPEKATITFYDLKNENVCSYVGRRAVYIDDQSTDSVVVCVTAHNRIPYIESLFNIDINPGGGLILPLFPTTSLDITHAGLNNFANYDVVITDLDGGSQLTVDGSDLIQRNQIELDIDVLKGAGMKDGDEIEVLVIAKDTNPLSTDWLFNTSERYEIRGEDAMPDWDVEYSSNNGDIKFYQVHFTEPLKISGIEFNGEVNKIYNIEVPNHNQSINLDKTLLVNNQLQLLGTQISLIEVIDRKGYKFPSGYFTKIFKNEGAETGLQSTCVNTVHETIIFDLMGRKIESDISSLTPGIYLINGRKIMITNK